MEIFLAWLTFSALVGWLAHSRGRSGFGFFLVAALLSPLVGLVVVLVTKNLNDERTTEQLRREEHERQLESIRVIAGSRATDTAAPVQSSAFPGSIADEIIKLADLRERGFITETEFQAQKTKLLDPQALRASTTATSPSPTTRGLCPNCADEIAVSSPQCPKCGADFAPGSSWAVKPLLRPR